VSKVIYTAPPPRYMVQVKKYLATQWITFQASDSIDTAKAVADDFKSRYPLNEYQVVDTKED
jgi:hypothetical protein